MTLLMFSVLFGFEFEMYFNDVLLYSSFNKGVVFGIVLSNKRIQILSNVNSMSIMLFILSKFEGMIESSLSLLLLLFSLISLLKILLLLFSSACVNSM